MSVISKNSNVDVWKAVRGHATTQHSDRPPSPRRGSVWANETLFRRGVGPLLPGAEYVEYALAKEADVAAVVVETVRSTDVQAQPRAYDETLRCGCDLHGALLILDEIPICLGRTGTMFAFERYAIVPDMVVLGKGLGGGIFPMAALIARAELDVTADRALGHYTHEKSSVGCAAALATIEVIDREQQADAAHLNADLERALKIVEEAIEVSGARVPSRAKA